MDCLGLLKDFVYESMLDIDPPGIASLKVTGQYPKPWRSPKRIDFEDLDQFDCLILEVTLAESCCVLLCLTRIDNFVTHQSRSAEAFSTPSSLAFWMDSTMPGIDWR